MTESGGSVARVDPTALETGVALLHPRRLTTIALGENGWVESPRGATGVGTPLSSSFVALAISRLFGVILLGIVATAAYYIARQ